MSKKKEAGGILIPNDPVLAAMAQQLTQVHVDLREKEIEAEVLAGVAEDLEIAMGNWEQMQSRLGTKLRPTPSTRAMVKPAAASPTRPTSKTKPPAAKAKVKTSSAAGKEPEQAPSAPPSPERVQQTLYADAVSFAAMTDTYCADRFNGKPPYTVRAIYDGLCSPPLICVAQTPQECWAYGVVPFRDWKRPTVANTFRGYIGVKFRCKGKDYVISGPHVKVVLEKSAKPAATAKPKTKPPAKGGQTWNQWIVPVRADFPELKTLVSERLMSPVQLFFSKQFTAGKRPSDAAKAWNNLQVAAAARTAEQARETFETESYDHVDLCALAKASLRMAATGIIPGYIDVPGHGQMAVVGMGDDENPARDRFYCQELLEVDETAESFELRAAQTPKGKPMELEGVGVTLRNPPGDRMFGAKRLILVVKKPGAEGAEKGD